jgi:20S proteasome alpha/beta subunit
VENAIEYQKPANVLHLPVRKPIPRKAHAMTMALSLTFRGGVVLCADQLITHGDASYGQAFGHYASKMTWFFTGPDSSIAICGSATDFDAMKSVIQSVEDKYDPDNQDNPALRDALETELEKALSKTSSQGLSIELLAVATKAGRSHLRTSYKCSGSHIVAASPFECIGIGDTSLVRYLADNLFDGRSGEAYTVVLGVYLLMLGKRYVPQFVGGATDVLVVSDGFCHEMKPEKVKELESKLEFATRDGLRQSIREISESNYT